MFKCKSCEVLREEIAYLRAQNERLIACANPVFAFTNKSEALPNNESGPKVTFDEYGMPILEGV